MYNAHSINYKLRWAIANFMKRPNYFGNDVFKVT